jgi:integrase
MKTISENLYQRGKHGTFYCRLRVPAALSGAYPLKKTHISRSLGTTDLRQAKKLFKVEVIRIDAEFVTQAAALKKNQALKTRKRISSLSEAKLKELADYWIRQTLLNDQKRRDDMLDDEEFDELGSQLQQNRAQLGRMLASGQSDKILTAMHGFIHLCGLDVTLTPDESKRAGFVFLTAVVRGLDFQLERHGGKYVNTNDVVPSAPSPKNDAIVTTKPVADWQTVFNVWRDYVPNRPKSTAIATQTPWRELEKCAIANNCFAPSEITPEVMRLFVDTMASRGLTVVTINERLAKIKALFKVVRGKGVVAVNPASDTIGLKENSFAKRIKSRLPFDEADLQTIFSSVVFNEAQLRSEGQSKEATYWIPILMFYTGARPEEIAGLALDDIVKDPKLGWYFNIIDRPSSEDSGLFEAGELLDNKRTTKLPTHSRILKNAKSIRKVPVAGELVELGLFRYMDAVKAKGHGSLFPSLRPDWHGKLSGSFSKFFGRYKKHTLNINSTKKVLYSFRHGMKDAMTRANIPTKQLQRILGHASGDGQVTDGYGTEDISLELVFKEFNKIKFFKIPAKPWMPGKGHVTVPIEKKA